MSTTKLDVRGVISTCAGCGRANRVAYDALGKTTRCGQCRTPIAAPAAPIDVEDAASFDAAANASALPMLVDFWAAWCGPCRMVAPELERVAAANSGRYLVLKVDTERHADLASRFRIRSIPTLALVFGGRELDRVAGAQPANQIEAFADRALAANARRAS